MNSVSRDGIGLIVFIVSSHEIKSAWLISTKNVRTYKSLDSQKI